MKIRKIEEVIPVLGFNGDVLVSDNLDLTIGLKLLLPEALSLSSEKIAMLHDTFHRAVNLLPANTLLHKQDFFLADKFRNDQNSDMNSKPYSYQTQSLTRSYLHHFEGRPFLRHECFLYKTFSGSDKKGGSESIGKTIKMDVITA